MTFKSLLVIIAGLGLAASAAKAESWYESRLRYEAEAVDKFPPHEFSLDLFGTYAGKDRWGGHNFLDSSGNPGKDDQWGGGLGMNFFFTRFVGIGADTYLEEWKWPYRVNGSLILRYPLQGAAGGGLAPYVFGGGGREFKYLTQWTFHGGGGLEFRWNRYTGVFSDARRVFSDRSSDFDYTLVRFGMRLSF